MSGLRDLVTGADACTPSDGAGPSNAASSLADALLGRRAKTQAQLQEVGARPARPRLQPRGAMTRRAHLPRSVPLPRVRSQVRALATCALRSACRLCSVKAENCRHAAPLPQLPGVQAPGPSVGMQPFAPVTADAAAAAALHGTRARPLVCRTAC